MSETICIDCHGTYRPTDDTEPGYCLDCSAIRAKARAAKLTAALTKRAERRRELRSAREQLQTEDSSYVEDHSGALNTAFLLGVTGWIVLIVGLLGAIAAGIAAGQSCEETTVFGETQDCSGEPVIGVAVALTVLVYAAVISLLFFAIKHVLLLLAEIAEKD